MFVAEVYEQHDRESQTELAALEAVMVEFHVFEKSKTDLI